MANDISLTVSENAVAVPLNLAERSAPRSVSPENGSPYYVGARAYVTQTQEGATITITDKEGTTTADVHHGEKGEKGDDAEVDNITNAELEEILV